MRRIAVVAALTFALGALSGCAVDGYSDYGGGPAYGGSYGYRPAPQPYWGGGGYAPRPSYGYRGDDGGRFRGGDQGRRVEQGRGPPVGSPPSRDPRPAFLAPSSARPAPGPGPSVRGGPQGGRAEQRQEQGAD